MKDPDLTSALQRSLSAGRFTITAEVSPPVSTDPAAFLATALPLKGLATALNVTDGASARVHMSSLVAAHFLVLNGIEPVLQIALRDRNRIALQSDLLGAAVVRRYAARLLELGIAPALPVLIGVAPIPSARSARWMRDKLPGSVIPDALIERLEKSSDPKSEGKRICIELLLEFAEIPGIAGAHIMAPQFHSAIAEVIADSGVTARMRKGAKTP